MREELDNKIDSLINVLDSDKRLKDLVCVKDRLLNNKEFIFNINKLNTLDKYSDSYVLLKKELFNNSDFILYKELETEINFLILNINKRLNTLTGKKGCIHENN